MSGNRTVKVPLVMQMETTECGAACLAMILAYYGKWVPLEKIREDCGVNRDGASAGAIIKSAQFFGLEAKGRMIRLEALREKQPFPCILFWEFSHFVVLTGFRGDKAFLNDPAFGEVRIPLEEFNRKYAGVALTFEKTDAFVPDGNPTDILLYVRRRLRGLRNSVFFIMAATAVTSLSLLLGTSLSRVFLDDVLSGDHPEWLRPLIIIMLLAAITGTAGSVLNAVYLLRIRGKTAAVSSARFFRHLLYLPMAFFAQRSAGDLQLRQNENETITFTFVGQLAPLFINTVTLLLYLRIMLRYSVVLTAVGVLTILLSAFSSLMVSRKRVNVARAMSADLGKFYGATVCGIETIESIKAAGAENEFFSSWAGYQANVNDADLKMTRINEYFGLIPEALSQLAGFVVLILGIRMIILGEMTPGSLLAFTGFMTAFLNPVMSIIHLGETVQEAVTQMERIEDVMNYPADHEEIPDPGAGEAEWDGRKLVGQVELEHVTFGYSKHNPPFIEDFSLKLEPGKWVALVGASGCGKSTIVRLITDLYTPWSGTVSINGVPVRKIPRNVLRSSMLVVDQDIISFNDTVSDNIKLWDRSIEDFEVILACCDAEIHQDIINRPNGYQSMIEPRGGNFSGGQKQRLEIARVLAQDPTIVILDEATCALDAQTEERVIRHIRDRGVTCIISAHRLSTVRDCDEIIVMDHGRIIERGNHDELMALDGAYSRLIRSE